MTNQKHNGKTECMKQNEVRMLAERKVNVGKAQKKGDDKRKMVVRVRGRRLETVREVKYLGVWIQEGMRGDNMWRRWAVGLGS